MSGSIHSTTPPKGFDRHVDYAVVDAEDPRTLAARVTDLLGQGFLPIGGISSTGTIGVVGSGGWRLLQAMLRVVDLPEETEEEGAALEQTGPTRLIT